MVVSIYNGGSPGVLYELLVACAWYALIAASLAELASSIPSSGGGAFLLCRASCWALTFHSTFSLSLRYGHSGPKMGLNRRLFRRHAVVGRLDVRCCESWSQGPQLTLTSKE